MDTAIVLDNQEKSNSTDSAKLTPKQKMFVKYYVETLNATEAYEQAYKTKDRIIARVSGSRLLKNPLVANRLRSIFPEIVEPDVSQSVGKYRNSPNILYVIKDSHGSCKIGITGNLQHRLSTFRISNPYDIQVVFELRTDSASDIESQLHDKFESKRISGEWFSLTSGDIEWIQQKYGIKL